MQAYLAWHVRARRVMAVSRKGLSDWPLRYDTGHVVYDFPEHFTQGFRDMVSRLLNEWHRKGIDPSTVLPHEGK